MSVCCQYLIKLLLSLNMAQKIWINCFACSKLSLLGQTYTLIKWESYCYYTEGNPFTVPIYLMIAPIWIWPRAETTAIKHNLKLYSGKPKDSIAYLLMFINRQLRGMFSSLAVLKSFRICRQKIWFLSSGDNQIWRKEKRKWWPLGIMGISH